MLPGQLILLSRCYSSIIILNHLNYSDMENLTNDMPGVKLRQKFLTAMALAGGGMMIYYTIDSEFIFGFVYFY